MATASVGTEVEGKLEARSLTPEILTLAEAAAFLRVTEESVLRAMADQGLEARQIGGEWRFLRSAIEDWLRDRSPKARLMAQFGALKDDPSMDEMIQNIYAARARQRDETF